MPTATASRKRKQSDDMEVSPPKRVTRARAAAKTQTTDSASAGKRSVAPGKAMKASIAKAETKSSKTPGSRTAKTAATTKRSVKATEPESEAEGRDTDNDTDAAEEVTQVTEPPKTRGRPRKAAASRKEEGNQVSEQKPRGRQPKASGTRVTGQQTAAGTRKQVRTTRVVALRAADSDSEDDELMAPDAAAAKAPEPAPKKTTRTRAANGSRNVGRSIKVTAPSTRAAAAAAAAAATKSSTASRATSATASTSARAAATAGNRRVAFIDESQDKENRPVSQDKDVKDSKGSFVHLKSSTGVQGKPVRKNATSVPTTNDSHAKASSATKQSSDEDRPKTPLSPKKVDQVAKGNGNSPAVDHASSSEDELSGKAAASRSPVVRPLQKSPVKVPASARQELPNAGSSVRPGSSGNNGARPSSKDGNIFDSGSAGLLSRSPVRPPPSPSSPTKSVPPIRPGSSGGASSRDGEQTLAMNVRLLATPAKRPPPSPLKDGGPSSAAMKMGLVTSQKPELPNKDGSVKKNLLQSPARRPKVAGAMTSIPREKKVVFPFGDKDAQGEQGRAFKFAAATPKRIKLLKPSQRLLDDVVEEDEEKPRAGDSPGSMTSPAGTDTDGDASMLDVQDNTIIYTPSKKKRTSLFDSPLVRRSRPNSPQKVDAFTPMSHATVPDLASAATSVVPTEKTSRILFREDRIDDSDDETSNANATKDLSMDIATPIVHIGDRLQRRASRLQARESHGMTRLADQFSEWLAGSPEKESAPGGETDDRTNDGKLQSPVKNDTTGGPAMAPPREARPSVSPAKSSYFEDEMAVTESIEVTETGIDLDLEFTNGDMAIHGLDVDTTPEEEVVQIFEDGGDTAMGQGQSQSDQNELPIDPALELTQPAGLGQEPALMSFEMPQVHSSTTTANHLTTADPLALSMTPAKAIHQPREVLTVSKVPLKPADSVRTASPTKAFRRKAKSMAPVGAPLGEVDLRALVQPGSEDGQQPGTPERADPSQGEDSTLASLVTPLRTPRVGADAQILRGAVVYVDVHTTEGADASGLFVELLNQMGARCVKQWSWNPRSSSIGAETPGGSKVGITHVVFKDGGKRTLEKVREAQGLVNCVGVGWVLDCERHNQWLDESGYTIDTSVVPRGGHNRRKSMEPTALANINGTLTPARQTPGGTLHRRSASTPVTNVSPTKEFLTFSATPGPLHSVEDVDAYTATPTISGPTFSAPTPTINFSAAGAAGIPLPETPAMLKGTDWDFETPVAATRSDDQQDAEPTTPYFMTEGARLVQATCPPKQQTGRRLFPVSGRIEDEPDQDIRRRLELARRKSLQWAPRIGSPLRKS